MDICFAGDCNFISEIYEIEPDRVIIDPKMWQADKHFVNLEQVISENKITTNKYMMHSGKVCIPYIEKLDIDGVSLANNHIHDKGEEGIKETIQYLEQKKIKCTGAGKDILEAEKPIKIDSDIYMLAFCDYGKKYLRDVKCASEKNAGVNFFSVDRVLEQLDRLPQGASGIIYIHWGIEYSWLPPYECIDAAKQILKHPKVKLLIGQHAHIPLGWIKENGKYAFFSLGNFLFPNFYLCPPNIVKSSCRDAKKNEYTKMKMMCNVKVQMYKQWYFINRVSLLVHYNTQTGDVNIKYSIQDKNQPYLRELTGIKKVGMKFWLKSISKIYTVPSRVYKLVFRINLFILYGIRKVKRGMVNYYAQKRAKACNI